MLRCGILAGNKPGYVESEQQVSEERENRPLILASGIAGDKLDNRVLLALTNSKGGVGGRGTPDKDRVDAG